VATTTVNLVREIPSVTPNNTKVIDLRSISKVQKKYFMEAWGDFQSDMLCWNFEHINFSKRLFEIVSRGEDILQHPLYLALVELWLALGVNQGEVAGTKNETLYIVI